MDVFVRNRFGTLVYYGNKKEVPKYIKDDLGSYKESEA